MSKDIENIKKILKPTSIELTELTGKLIVLK